MWAARATPSGTPRRTSPNLQIGPSHSGAVPDFRRCVAGRRSPPLNHIPYPHSSDLLTKHDFSSRHAQELDDALCLVFLFASLSPSKFVPASRVATCVRLRTEFLAYVARTNALRFTFISIKGIYYQAEIHGVLLTWIEPHHCFAQQPTMTVDYRVMLSFLELYDAMLTFVNFKLYHDLGLAYPPLMDSDARQAGQHISAVLLSKAAPSMAVEPTVQERARLGTAPSSASSDAAPSERQLSELRSKLTRLDDNPEHVHELHHDPATAKSSPEEAVIYESNPEAVALRILFSSCNLFCCRCGRKKLLFASMRVLRCLGADHRARIYLHSALFLCHPSARAEKRPYRRSSFSSCRVGAKSAGRGRLLLSVPQIPASLTSSLTGRMLAM